MGSIGCRKGEYPHKRWIFKNTYTDTFIPPKRLTYERHVHARISSQLGCAITELINGKYLSLMGKMYDVKYSGCNNLNCVEPSVTQEYIIVECGVYYFEFYGDIFPSSSMNKEVRIPWGLKKCPSKSFRMV
jgi:hypothetical protein